MGDYPVNPALHPQESGGYRYKVKEINERDTYKRGKIVTFTYLFKLRHYLFLILLWLTLPVLTAFVNCHGRGRCDMCRTDGVIMDVVVDWCLH